MIAKLALGVVFIAVLLCALLASAHWNDDKHQLLVTTSGCAAGPNPCARIDCYRKDTRKWA